MPAPGDRLGPYEVLGPLGKGGMGEVFRARDTRLGREVAIKALPQAFAADPERLARFEREARLLASLSHPNIAGIHGLEEAHGQRFLVLEFVEGETLGDRLARGALPLDDSLDIARQIAAALEAAHEAGIVHRDLKPGNVMLTPSGGVKVLDFGLAKGGAGAPGSDPNLSASPTMTYAATEVGVILGTAAYMSPEQARGRAVDRRTDIWSFGCVLLECLTGRQQFAGETVSDTVARILEREPDWNALPARTPQRVRELLRRCLEKDAKKRLRDIGDARLELDELTALGASGLVSPSALAGGATGAMPAAQSWLRSVWLPWLVAAVAIVAAASAGLALRGGSGGPGSNAHPLRATILGPPDHRLSSRPSDAALSPDGRWIVMVVADSSGASALWLRSLESLEARPIPGAEIGDAEGFGLPFWSPDGKSIGYFSADKLKTIPWVGGDPQVLCDAPDPRGGSWGTGGVILFSPTSQSPVFRISASGGEPVQVTHLDTTLGESAHRFPTFLPDGKRFTYSALPQEDGKYACWLQDLSGGRPSLVTKAESGIRFVPPNHLVFTRDQSLVAVPVAPSSLQAQGEPFVIGVAPSDLGTQGTPAVTCASDGTLLYPTRIARNVRPVWFGRDGKPHGAFPISLGNDVEYTFSPDDRRIAIVRYNTATSSDLWIADVATATMSRLTHDGVERRNLVWSPDGKKLAFNTEGGNQELRTMDVDSGEEELLFRDAGMFKVIDSWTSDGKYLVYQQRDAKTRIDVWLLPLDGERTPRPLFRTPANERTGFVSPDGRWILYISDETGRSEVYVRSFPDLGKKTRVTKDGALFAVWSRDGQEILILGATRFYVASARTGETIEIGPVRTLFEPPPDVQTGGIQWDFQRLLLGLPATQQSPDQFTFLKSWTSLAQTR